MYFPFFASFIDFLILENRCFDAPELNRKLWNEIVTKYYYAGADTLSYKDLNQEQKENRILVEKYQSVMTSSK